MFHANQVCETHPQCLQEAQTAEAGDCTAPQGGTKWTKLARLLWQTVSPGLGKHDKRQPTRSKISGEVRTNAALKTTDTGREMKDLSR